MLKKTISRKVWVSFFSLLLSFSMILTYRVTDISAHLYEGYSILDHFIPFPKMKYDCEGAGLNPEFHSLRPYEASPCGDSPKTYYCWNNYNLVEGLKTIWQPWRCTDYGSYYSCNVDQQIDKIYVIDGEYAMFPIMGNTNSVTNGLGPPRD